MPICLWLLCRNPFLAWNVYLVCEASNNVPGCLGSCDKSWLCLIKISQVRRCFWTLCIWCGVVTNPKKSALERLSTKRPFMYEASSHMEGGSGGAASSSLSLTSFTKILLFHFRSIESRNYELWVHELELRREEQWMKEWMRHRKVVVWLSDRLQELLSFCDLVILHRLSRKSGSLCVSPLRDGG